MKTLLVSEVFPPRKGGSGRWFWEVYRRSDPSRCMILAGCHPGDAEFDATHELNVQRVPLTFPTWGVASLSGYNCYRSLVKSMRVAVESLGPNQIHCGKILPEGLAANWVYRKLGIPYLCYVHGEELSIADASRELRWLTRRVFSNANCVIANSENTAGLLSNDWNVDDSRLRILHPGVDINDFQPAISDPLIRERLAWSNRRVVLTVGRLQKRKGQDQLIRTLPGLIESFPDLLYSVIGDGPERASLENLVHELKLHQHVEFRGEVDDLEMLQCYQQCDLFALPNRTIDGDFEGFGMVLLEAQACARSVIAGRSGGTHEAMMDGKTGLLTDCDRLESLEYAVRRLLADDQLRTSMGQVGRRWVEENFGWDSLVKKASETFLSRTS